MRKICLYIAMSLNGKIAASDGNVDWLETIPNPDGSDYGYKAFYEEIDTTLQGFNTYQQILNWGIPFPYAGKKNYVLTRKKDLENTKDVSFVKDTPLAFIKGLKQQKGKNIWLIGGSEVNTLLLNAGLIDEIQVFVMPIILPDGIDLFAGIPDKTNLRLVHSESFASGAVRMTYQVENQNDFQDQ